MERTEEFSNPAMAVVLVLSAAWCFVNSTQEAFGYCTKYIAPDYAYEVIGAYPAIS
jgi:hypothetical protein